MGRGRPAQRVKLSTADRRSLEALVRRGTEEQRDVFRARIALMANRGDSTEAIAEMLRTTLQTVSLWRGRVGRFGLAGLVEQVRSGRPRRITPAERLQVISLASFSIDPWVPVSPPLSSMAWKWRRMCAWQSWLRALGSCS